MNVLALAFPVHQNASVKTAAIHNDKITMSFIDIVQQYNSFNRKVIYIYPIM